MSENNELISIGKAAELLGITIQTLRRWDSSGKLTAHKTTGGQRRYLLSELLHLMVGDVTMVAENWAMSDAPPTLAAAMYCTTRADFELRLQRFGDEIAKSGVDVESYPLIISVAGEIGNNSFDHNLGQWPDVPGIFFSYDLSRGAVVLADRGQGILSSLRRVRPDLTDASSALRVAFSEVVTGRAPEKRGNGLKFVRKMVEKGAAGLLYRSGEAQLTINSGSSELVIRRSANYLRGTFASLKFNPGKIK